jgi:uncharacterized membrane protein
MTIQSQRQGNGSPGGPYGQMERQGFSRHDRDRMGESSMLSGNGEQLSRALGWFSLGLGLAQVVAPSNVANLIGLRDDRDHQSILRAVGLREIASGVGILSQRRPAGWVKARVGGDLMDLGLLSAALNSDDADQGRVVMALAAVAGITVLDVLCTQQLSQDQQWNSGQQGWQVEAQRQQQPVRAINPSVPAKRGIHVTETITINRSAEDIYQFWRNFENLPQFMRHLESVHVSDETHSYWRAKAPAGMTVGWDAEIIDDTPGERISWRSLEGADVPNAGSVRFKPATGNRGTVVTVQIEYMPPGGAIGAAIAKLFGEEPAQQVRDDLRLFKQVMETGEIVRSDATPQGPTAAQRPAQPVKAEELEGIHA